MIFTATCSKGMETALSDELKHLNIQRVHPETAAVRFHDKTLSAAYRACIQSRLASRILVRIHRFDGVDADALYQGVQEINWSDHIRSPNSLWVDVVGTTSQLRHSQFTARLTKDAIVDQLRDTIGYRPSVSRENGLRIHLHLRNGVVTVSIDLCGQSLHWRTPNRQTGSAPMKETLAAYLLHLADWPTRLKTGSVLVDGMSGSGTLALEAASIALKAPPNLHRKNWGFEFWNGHRPKQYQIEMERAKSEQLSTLTNPIFAQDKDHQCIQMIRANARNRQLIGIESRCSNFLYNDPPSSTTGLIVMNPPYGERLEDEEASLELYAEIGDTLKKHYQDWDAFMLCPTKQHRHQVHLRHYHRTDVFNGQLKCQWLGYAMYDGKL